MSDQDHKLPKDHLVSRTIAPEDIRAGMFVCVLHVIGQYVPYYDCDSLPATIEPVRYRRLPDRREIQPMQVVEVCLPFVLVRTARGRMQTLDVRRYRLARASDAFGKAFFEAVEADRKKERKDGGGEKAGEDK